MELLFNVLNLVVPTLTLSLFALHYQLIKKVEIRIEVQLAKQRLKAYEDIYSTFVQLARTETPSLELQSEVDEIMTHFDFVNVSSNFSTVVATEKDFDKFFDHTQKAVSDNSILLDYNTMCEAQSSMAILSQLKSILDAFCDVTHMYYPEVESEPKNVQQRIDKAYRLAAILMQNEYNRCFLKLEDTISHQMSHIEVVPSKRYLKRFGHWIHSNVMYLFFCLGRLRAKPLVRFSQFIMRHMMGHSRQLFLKQQTEFTKLLEYIYVSDKYSFQQYLQLNDKEYETIHQDFWLRMRMQMHTVWIM